MHETDQTHAITRNLIFISHANPEDNVFSRWLALQLAKEGYPVWCDLTEYLGGEDAWNSADKAINEGACKFLFVLSKTSNSKPGVLKELMVAENVTNDNDFQDFIIPLLIDDLPQRKVNIQLARLFSVDFRQSWAAGLDGLLKKLEKDQVSKSDSFSPNAVASWWRGNFSASEGVQDKPEECLSNWFPIVDLPETIYSHYLTRGNNGVGPIDVPIELPFPGVKYGANILTFAKADDFQDQLGLLSIEETKEFPTASFMRDDSPELPGTRSQRRNAVVELLGKAWERMMLARDLPIYELANERKCFYFSSGLCGEDDKVRITGVNGKNTYRQMFGYSSVIRPGETEKSKRYWMFGVQGYPIVYPEVAFVFKSHVVFSDDGYRVWEDKKRLHQARRSQCKNWWNDAWRDRLLCAASWLSGEDGIEISVASNLLIHVAPSPITFTSPVSYVLPDDDVLPEVDDNFVIEELVDDDEYDEYEEL